MTEKEIERLKKLKQIEETIYAGGVEKIAGLDEAGRGPLCGPVVVAAVIMPQNSMIEWVNDSKKVTEKRREILYDKIIQEAISYSIAVISHETIDQINILQATKQGFEKCILELDIKPDMILLDAITNIDTQELEYESIIKGDAKSYNIAAASILAKVTRDRIMMQYDSIYPEYGFKQNKGYGTAKHIEAIKKYGLCPIHRRSFTKNFTK